MPLRRLNLVESASIVVDGQQHTSPSSITTASPISDQQLAHPSYLHEQILDEMPQVHPPVPPPHLLGRATDQAVSNLAKRLFQNVMSAPPRGRRKSGGDPNSTTEQQNSKTGTSREPSVTFSFQQNEQIAYDEEANSERSQMPSDRQPVRRTTSTPRNGSINGDPLSSIHMNSAHPPLRRGSRASSHIRGSISNISEMIPGGPVVLYNPPEHMLYPPPMLSRAPSVNQIWFPQPPPQFSPYYYGPSPFTAVPMPPDAKTMRKAMKQARKLEKKRRLEADIAMDRIGCTYYCCDGVAQLLWTIIAVTLLGFVSALILALFIL